VKRDELTHADLGPCLALGAVDDDPPQDSGAAEPDPFPGTCTHEPAGPLFGRLTRSLTGARASDAPPAARLCLRVEGMLSERAFLATEVRRI
jgi:hypothetical protein